MNIYGDKSYCRHRLWQSVLKVADDDDTTRQRAVIMTDKSETPDWLKAIAESEAPTISAAEINALRSAKSWAKIVKVLRKMFSRKAGYWPSKLADRDITGELYFAFRKRCEQRSDALTKKKFLKTLWRSAGDVAVRHKRVISKHREREADAVQGYIFLKRYAELIPCQSADPKTTDLMVDRTERQKRIWSTVVQTTAAIAADPERSTFRAKPETIRY